MSGLPYPVNDMGPSFPVPNSNGPYGHPAQGALPYPMSDTPESFPYPPISYPDQQSYPTSEPTITAFNVPYPLPDHVYPSHSLGPEPVPYPVYGHGQVDPSIGYPPQISFPTPQQNTPYPSGTFAAESSHPLSSTSGSSVPYPTGGFEGKDTVETVEYQEGLRKSLFSKSGLIGKAIDKGISLRLEWCFMITNLTNNQVWK